jgi:DNA polymerase III sliding clamp (beta) subunit (PCNA family)
MQIRVDKLRSKLALLHQVVPKKPSLALLVNVLVNDGRLEASDLEQTVSLDLPESRGCCFLLPYRAVTDVLKYVPGDELLTIDASKKGTIKLIWSSGSAGYPVSGPEDFPRIEQKEGRAQGNLDGDILINALVDSLPYASTEESRPVLNNVAVHLDTGLMQIAAADGFRTSYQSVNLVYPIKESILLSPETVKILEELWKKEPGKPPLANNLIAQLTAHRELTLHLWGDYVTFQFGGIRLHSKAVAGTHPDILNLMNGFKEPIKVRFMAPEMLVAINRVKKLVNEAKGAGIAKLLWADGKMTISASKAEVGDISASIPIESPCEPGRIAINVNYLLDYLSGKDGLITMGIESRDSPALFHYGSRPVVAIMPMKVKWDDEPEPEATTEAPATAETTNPAPEALSEEDKKVIQVPADSEAASILAVDNITIGEVKAKIKEAEQQSTAWDEVREKETDPEKIAAANQEIESWQKIVDTLEDFLDELDSDEKTEEEETSEEKKEAAAV